VEAAHGAGSVSLITARGCPYHCRWCSHSTFGKTHRRRSVASVADETEWILNRYQPEMLWYADDVFTIHTGWTLAYAAEIKRRGIRVPFECITRADRFSAPVAAALAEMGCFRVWIGSESGSQRVLDAMQRGVQVEQVRTAVRLAQAHGIQTGMFLMWGYEGEQIQDIEATVEHVQACPPDVFLTTVTYPIKGTPYHNEVGDKLVRIGEWRASTDRDVRIKSRRFYQFADDLLRSSMERPEDPRRVAAARAALQASFAEVDA
jgi:anaerobic magnesium-protoporphyrin IX monomethyl ester cyclase